MATTATTTITTTTKRVLELQAPELGSDRRHQVLVASGFVVAVKFADDSKGS